MFHYPVEIGSRLEQIIAVYEKPALSLTQLLLERHAAGRRRFADRRQHHDADLWPASRSIGAFRRRARRARHPVSVVGSNIYINVS